MVAKLTTLALKTGMLWQLVAENYITCHSQSQPQVLELF
jgi:hypothetical protein